MRRRLVVLALMCAIALSACGNDELSMREYLDRTHQAAGTASERGAELLAEAAAISDPTPAISQAGLERALGEIRIPLQEAVDALEPPESIADLHDTMWTWHAELITIEQTLADRFGKTPDTNEGWSELSESPEVAAYRASLAEGKQLCLDLQGALDERAERGLFADTPWAPDELGRAVHAALGCEFFPENPEDVYRYP